MKKTLITIMCALFSAHSFAQIEDNIIERVQKNQFSLGVKAGLNFTSMTDPSECSLNKRAATGYSASLAAKLRFRQATENSPAGTGTLALGVEVKYASNKVKTLATDEKGIPEADLLINKLSVPVFVQLYPLSKVASMNTFYLEAGAEFALMLSSKPKSLTVSGTPGKYPFISGADKYNSITYNFDKDGSKLKSNDLRILVGAGYTIPGTGLDINARYYIGTSKLAENMPCKLSTAEISLAWMFNAGKL